MAASEQIAVPAHHPLPNGANRKETEPVVARAAQPQVKLRALVVEDDPADVELVSRALQRNGFDVLLEIAETADSFTTKIRGNSYDVVLADYNLPTWNGMDTVEILRREGLDVPVILVSGYLGEQKAVECIKRGAADYVLKDNLTHLPESVRQALREKNLREENRRTQEELARSNRDLEQFAYVASHDLQEPLRMVATYTQLLAERYRGKLDENADKYIHYAVDGALRMQVLIQDLLAFSRVGRSGAEFRLVEISAVVQSALRNLESTVRENNARIDYATLPAVLGDATQLVQLFQNLISNAIKFRGTSSPLIRIAATKQAQEWLFSIEDNGIGIAPEHAELVFAIFKRLHTRSEYPGSGIGLAVCKKVVEQHGGRIWVESQPGQGSTFKFTLPIHKSKESDSPK